MSERILRDHCGSITDAWLIEVVGLAILRRQRSGYGAPRQGAAGARAGDINHAGARLAVLACSGRRSQWSRHS